MPTSLGRDHGDHHLADTLEEVSTMHPTLATIHAAIDMERVRLDAVSTRGARVEEAATLAAGGRRLLAATATLHWLGGFMIRIGTRLVGVPRPGEAGAI
jgi:hypothetical protein